MFSLYPAILLKVLIRSRKFLVVPLRPFKYRVISSPNRTILKSSFPIYISFISFPCLIALPKNSKTILNKSRESGYSYLIYDFRGKAFSFAHLV
jgi:hypothetical protein